MYLSDLHLSSDWYSVECALILRLDHEVLCFSTGNDWHHLTVLCFEFSRRSSIPANFPNILDPEDYGAVCISLSDTKVSTIQALGLCKDIRVAIGGTQLYLL